MSAETDFRKILTGGEQANQSVVYDEMVGNSPNIVGRVAPSGQTWGVGSGSASDNVEVTGGVMKLQAGSESHTVYPYLQSPTNIVTIGAELTFTGATGGAVLLIAVNPNDLNDSAFLHFIFDETLQYFRLDWYAAGLNGGTTATTGVIPVFIRATEVYVLQGLVSGDSNDATVTFSTSVGTIRLSGLTLPGNLTYGIWEFAGANNSLNYRKVWANPDFALMAGQTLQPLSPNLSKLSSGDPVVLQQVLLSNALRVVFTTGGVFGLLGAEMTYMTHGTATLVAGAVTVNNANITANSRIFVNRFTDGGTVGDSYTVTRSAGVSFTIQSKLNSVNQAADTSVVAYWVVNG